MAKLKQNHVLSSPNTVNFTNIYWHFLFLPLQPFPHLSLTVAQVDTISVAISSLPLPLFLLCLILWGKKKTQITTQVLIVLGPGFFHLATGQIFLLVSLPEWTLSSAWWSCSALHWRKVALAALAQPILAFPQHLSLLAVAVWRHPPIGYGAEKQLILFFLMLFPKAMKSALENVSLCMPFCGASKPIGSWGIQPLGQEFLTWKKKM